MIQKIAEDYKAEQDRAWKKSEETRALLRQCQIDRENQKLEKERQDKQEEEQIRRYYDIMERREAEEDARKRNAEELKRQQWARTVEETNKQIKSREEFDALRDLLWQEESEAKCLKEDRDRISRQNKMKQETWRVNQEQIEEKKRQRTKWEDEEKRMVQIMIEKFAEDDKEELRRQRQRQLNKQKFVEGIMHQRAERVRMFESQLKKELSERHKGEELENYRQQVISDAREKLLNQHAEHLKGFLPQHI